MSSRHILAPEIGQHDFPQFDSPPLVETVLSVQYERLQNMSPAYFGLYWHRIRDRYPTSEEQPPLLPQFEQNTVRAPQSLRLEFQQNMHRLWLLNIDKTEMIQVQNDRFIKNWRKHESESYPRYEPVIRPAFERDYRDFVEFVSDEKLGEVKINQCEVTYVNHIISGEGWRTWDEIDKVFTFWRQSSVAVPHLGQTENFGVQLRFPILSAKNGWIGRLHVDVQPAFTAIENKPMYVMQLTARGMSGEGYDFFDVGHWSVIKMFDQLTTPEMHVIWRKRAS